MSVPTIPEREQLEAITDIIESVALEQVALAHLINAEAEKVQDAIQKLEHDEMLELQEEVRKVLVTSIKKEILLQFKLEEALDFKKEMEIPKKRPRPRH